MTTAEARFLRRKNAVDAVSAGIEPAKVAKVLKTSLRSVFDWLSRYRQGGYDALRDRTRSGRPRKVSAEVMEWLYLAITLGDPRQQQFEFCLWTLAIVRAVLKSKFDISLSKSGVSRLLAHLGLTPQRPIYRSYRQNPEEMERYLRETFPELKDLARRTGAAIYFVDESGVRADEHRGTTWGKRGVTPVVQTSGARFRFGIISAISPRGDLHFEILEGRMNSARFLEFLRKLRADAGRPIIVICDNVRYHKSKEVMAFMAEAKGDIQVEYLPPYAPELNPDEQVWNQLKAQVSRLFITCLDQLKAEVRRILETMKNLRGLLLSFFRLPDTKYASDWVAEATSL